MKNEVMARAITEIDDELIVSAHRPASSGRNTVKYFSAFAAACLLVICGVIFLLNRDSGSTPKIVFGEAVISTQQSKIATYDLWQIPQALITVPVEIYSERELEITAVDGTISVFSAETGEQIYVGQSCKTSGDVKAEWTIEDPDTDKTYRITVNNRETVYMLRYDQTSDQWSVTETEE